MTAYPDSQGSDAVPPAIRTVLLAELEGYEHLLFEPMTQVDLDGLVAKLPAGRAARGPGCGHDAQRNGSTTGWESARG